MNETVAKLAGLSVLLIAVWIGVYWLTPSEPRVTFADLEAAADSPARSQQNPVPLSTWTQQETSQPKLEKPSTDIAHQTPETRPVAIVPPEFMDHIVQKDETFDSIAKKYFGGKANGSVIARANPFVDPLRLRPGRVIRIPKDPKNIQGIPVAAAAKQSNRTSRQTYVVKSGDSLSRIAARLYGDSSLAPLIFEANRDQLEDVDSLKLGQTLVIPEHHSE